MSLRVVGNEKERLSRMSVFLAFFPCETNQKRWIRTIASKRSASVSLFSMNKIPYLLFLMSHLNFNFHLSVLLPLQKLQNIKCILQKHAQFLKHQIKFSVRQ